MLSCFFAVGLEEGFGKRGTAARALARDQLGITDSGIAMGVEFAGST
jgi:hypothetical protein